MAICPVQLARKLVDIHVEKKEITRLMGGMTPGKLSQVVRHMNVVEMMMCDAEGTRAQVPGKPVPCDEPAGQSGTDRLRRGPKRLCAALPCR
jgi:Propanediol dehydratase, large subunit